MFNSQITISKLTAHSPARIEALQARLRTGRLLQTADLVPAGFPPQAILFLRRAVAMQPVSLASFHLRPQWEREMRARVSEMYRRAVRPVRGMVPAAEAVLFADEGEWLACLGVAIRHHRVELDWCWRAALGERASAAPQTLARVWTEAPRSVPAALVHLARWERAVEVLQLLSERDTEAIAIAVAAEWNVPLPIARESRQQAVALAPTATSDKPNRNAPGTESPAAFQLADAPALSADSATGAEPVSFATPEEEPSSMARTGAMVVSPPWQRWLPHAEAACIRLPLATQRLLAMAVAIFHSPAKARSRRFARELNEWLNRATPHAPAAAPAPARSSSRVSPDLDSDAEDNAANRESPAIEVEARGQRKNSHRREERGHRTPKARHPQMEPMDVADEKPSVEDRQPWFDLEGQPTRLGGVLYLLNLFLHTDLPGCFDEQGELSEHLSGWGLAELLGRALLGDVDETDLDDPLWALLARLDGRQPGELPAADFQGRDDFHLPAEWLMRFVADEPWAIAQTDDRLICWHRMGDFVIADCARRISIASDGERSSATSREMEEIAEHYCARGISPQWEEHFSAPPRPMLLKWMEESPQSLKLSPPLRLWACRTLPFLHHLLTRALGDAARDRRTLAQTLLRKPGLLYCTATHVDLVMPLDQISLPVRCAGFDADPGWVRDLMRVVKFHFE